MKKIKMTMPLKIIHDKFLKPGSLYLVGKVCKTLKFQRITEP